MKISKAYQLRHYWQEIPVVQLNATRWQVWKFKRAYKKMLKRGMEYVI